MNFATGSASTKWPSSSSIMMPIETIGFVIEKMRKIEFCAIGAGAAGFCLPSASNQPIWPRRATITVMPGRVPLSISRLKASDIRCSRIADKPSASGLAWGSGGVCGAGLCFTAACGVMVSPFVLVARLGASLAQNARIEQGVWRKAPSAWRGTLRPLAIESRDIPLNTTRTTAAVKNRGQAAGDTVSTRSGLARIAVLAIAIGLTGCVTTAENLLSANDIAGMKLTGINVSFYPDAGVQWEDGIRAYA